MAIAYISLAVSLIALVFVVLVYSQTRETFRRISAIICTLPGAYDVERLMKDMEKTGETRGKVVCDAPKSTHIAYEMPFIRIPRVKLLNDKIWARVHVLADLISGYYDIPVEREKSNKAK